MNTKNFIINELLAKQKEKFIGTLKFGIEHGVIVSEVLNNKPVDEKESFDFDLNFLDSDFFGNVEFKIWQGIVTSCTFQQTFQGNSLQRRINANLSRL